MATKCPNCGYQLPAADDRLRAVAIRLVAAAATRKPKAIDDLARVYARHAGCSHRAGRKAIERLAAEGSLVRTEPGMYAAR
jgi:hypothetical protein